jgi:hypothetical protein
LLRAVLYEDGSNREGISIKQQVAGMGHDRSDPAHWFVLLSPRIIIDASCAD